MDKFKDKVPFDLSSITGLTDLSDKFLQHAEHFDKAEISQLIENLGSTDSFNGKHDMIKELFDNSIEVLKGSHAFKTFFGPSANMQSLLSNNNTNSVFKGVSDAGKDILSDIDLSEGYENFLEKLATKKDLISDMDKDKIITQFGELDTE